MRAAVGTRCRLAGLIVVLASLVYSDACAPALSRSPETPAGRESETTALLHGKRLDLHLAIPATPAPDILVLYASGDGGWFGMAVDIWRQIASAGYATAGFSSRAFLRIDRPDRVPLSRDELTREYHVMAADALRAAGMPSDSRVILAGWSRGAAFSILVGGDTEFMEKLGGVLAIGLPEGEDLKINGDDDDQDDGTPETAGRHWLFDNYTGLSHLTSPCAVIQATHDNYFPAADARRRFGPDSPIRRFYEVEAKNHRFSGGKTAFDAALLDALTWISTTGASAAGATPEPAQR